MLIQKRYPELSKYLEEMQVTIPNIAHPRITKTNLLDYYDSLVSLFTDYGATHCAVIA